MSTPIVWLQHHTLDQRRIFCRGHTGSVADGCKSPQRSRNLCHALFQSAVSFAERIFGVQSYAECEDLHRALVEKHIPLPKKGAGFMGKTTRVAHDRNMLEKFLLSVLNSPLLVSDAAVADFFLPGISLPALSTIPRAADALAPAVVLPRILPSVGNEESLKKQIQVPLAFPPPPLPLLLLR